MSSEAPTGRRASSAAPADAAPERSRRSRRFSLSRVVQSDRPSSESLRVERMKPSTSLKNIDDSTEDDDGNDSPAAVASPTPSESASNRHDSALHPIRNLILVPRGEKPPPGFFQVSAMPEELGGRSRMSYRAPNATVGKGIKLFASRDSSTNSHPITSIVVVFENFGEFVPLDYEVVRTSTQKISQSDCNAGSSSKLRCLLAFSRGLAPNPIVDLVFCSASRRDDSRLEGFVPILRSPLGYKAVLNARSRSNSVHLCVRRDLSCVHALSSASARLNRPVRLSDPPSDNVVARKSSAALPKRVTNSRTNRVDSFEPRSNGGSPKRSSSNAFFRSSPRTFLSSTSIKRSASPSATVSPPDSPMSSGFLTSRRVTSPPQQLSAIVKEPVVAAQTPTQPMLVEAETPPPPVADHTAVKFTGLQLARLDVLNLNSSTNSTLLGSSGGSMSEQIAALLEDARVLEKAYPLVLACYSGTPQAALSALESLRKMAHAISPPSSKSQMVFLDFLIRLCCDCVGLATDALMCPALRLLKVLLEKTSRHVHPVSAHYALLAVQRSFDFMTRVEDILYESQIKRRQSDSMVSQSSSRPQSRQHDDDNTSETGPPAAAALFSPSGGGSAALPALAFELPGDRSSERREVLSEFPSVILKLVGGFACEDVDRASDEEEIVDAIEDIHVVLERHSGCDEVFALDLRLNVSRICGSDDDEVSKLTSLLWLLKAARSGETELSITSMSKDGSDSDPRRMTRAAASSFPLLDVFLTVAGGFGSSFTFKYAVRRLVSPFTALEAMADSDESTFEASLTSLSTLWTCFREELKVEFSVAFRHALLVILRSKHAPLSRRLKVLDTINSWIASSENALGEIFLNFENDCPVVHWNVFFDLLSLLTKLVLENHPLKLRTSAMVAVVNISQKLFELALLSINSSHKREESLESLGSHSSPVKLRGRSLDSTDSTSKAPKGVQSLMSDKTISTVRMRAKEERRKKETLEVAARIGKEKGAHRAVAYLVAAKFVPEDPVAVASALRVHDRYFDSAGLGEYLSAEGSSETEKKFMSQLRVAFVRQMSFVGVSFDQALRLYLTKAGFKLPGEAQRIERLIHAFARVFAMDHPNEFASEDAVLVLAFSVVMLNTDLHNPAIAKKRKMRKEDFVKNLSGVNDGLNFQKRFLEDLYDSISKSKIEMAAASEDTSSTETSWTQQGSFTSKTTEDVEMVATKLAFDAEMADSVRNGSAILASLGGEKHAFHTKISPETVRMMFETCAPFFEQLASKILDDSEGYPMEVVSKTVQLLKHSLSCTLVLGKTNKRRTFAQLLAKTLYWTRAQEKRSSDHTTHGINVSHGEKRMSRKKSHQISEDLNEPSHSGVIRGDHLEQEWFERVVNSSSLEAKANLELVSELIAKVSTKISKRQHIDAVEAVSKRFDASLALTYDPSRKFVKEGSMLKKSKRARGKDRRYSFFLFSDVLVYASLRFGKFHVHRQLPLRTMRLLSIESWMFSFQRHSFEIRSPVKSIVVVCRTKREKADWLREIADTVVKLTAQQSPSAPPSAPAQQASTITTRLSTHSSIDAPSVVAAQVEEIFDLETPPGVWERSAKRDNVSVMDFSSAVSKVKPILTNASGKVASDAEKLEVYGLYKQSTKGDVIGVGSDKTDFVSIKKFEAWKSEKGTNRSEARRRFVDLVFRLAS